MVKMIVGLGNPGSEYKETKHNIGFMLLDAWAQKEGWTFNKTKFKALYTEQVINGQKLILVKPQTFMNLSGQAVKPLLDYFKVGLADLAVVHDDMDMPIGKVRLRQQGSAGGQKGVQDIIKQLGSQSFNRVRIGIGRPLEFETVIQHVLSPFLKIYQEEVDQSIQQGIAALEAWVAKDMSFANVMNQYN